MSEKFEQTLRLLILFDKGYEIKRNGNIFTLYADYMSASFVHTFYCTAEGKYEYINSVLDLYGEVTHYTAFDEELRQLVSLFFEVRRFYYKGMFDLMIKENVELMENDTIEI